LHGRPVGDDATEGPAMITIGIGLVAGVFYWLASYKLAFWILIYAIVYGALGILRGDNHARPIYRGASEFTVALLMPVAWHIGGVGASPSCVYPRKSTQKTAAIVSTSSHN